MAPSFIQLTFGFLVLAVIFGLIERLRPNQRQRRFNRALLTDLVYWFFTPAVTKSVTKISLALALIALLPLVGRRFDLSDLSAGYGPAAELPVWLQAACVLLIGDFLAYWCHRLFHGGRLWPFHAIHHSSEDLNWLSSVRVHPINDTVNKLVTAIPLVLLGFRPTVVAVLVPFFTFYSLLIHANVTWRFGPLRYFVVTPAFHRWHHSREPEALDKNFAGLFAFWDLVFGTYYVPLDRDPLNFGVSDDAPPESFTGQLLFPFRRRRRINNSE